MSRVFLFQTGSKIHQTEIDFFQNYPKIRYKDAPNSENNKIPKDSTEAPADKTSSEDTTTATEHVHALKTNFQYFGSNFMERIKIEDSYQYRFDYDSHKKKIELREPKEAVYIANNAGREVVYFLQRTRRSREDIQTLKSGQVRLHLLDKPPTEEILYNYPRIRFNNMTPTDVIDEITYTTTRLRYSTDQKLQTVRQFLNIDFKEETIDVTDVKKIETAGNYYHFGLHRQLENPGLIDLYPGRPLPPPTASKETHWVNQLGWAEMLIAAAIIAILLHFARVFILPTIIPPTKQIFSIQNNTDTVVAYQVKWAKSHDWGPIETLQPSDEKTEWHDRPSIKERGGHPKLCFLCDVDEKELKVHTLETYTRRFGPKTEKQIGRLDARRYHFELDSETQMLRLVDSENSD